MTSDPSRRRVLQVAGLTLAGGAVAGCSAAPGSGTDSPGGDGEGNDPTPTPTEGSSDGGSDGSSDSEWVETDTVAMTDQLGYDPKRIRVSAGTTVTWENTGNIGHTVTAYEDEIPDDAAYFASGGFDSQQAASDGYSDGEGNIPGGETYEYTFETAGTYKYYCIPHEMNGMVGFVEVV